MNTLRNMSILIVEDDLPSLILLDLSLREHITTVYKSRNGREGIDAFNKSKPDLIITDIAMPEMDGLEMTKLIREIDKKVPIICTTAFDNKETILKALNAGINGYLVKPIDKISLENTLSPYFEIIELERNAKQQAELEIALQKSEAENLAKSLFVAKVSHELRTPLNGVIGMASLLKDTELNDNQISKLNIIINSSKSLLLLINDILDFTKLEAGKLTLNYGNFELKSIVNDSISIIEAQAKEKSINIYIDFDTNLPTVVSVDSDRLKQILINLLSNAVKFTEMGDVKISLKLENDSEISFIYFEVCDSGIGISKEKASLLFKSFSQIDNSLSRKYGGTGLGLAISKELVEMMQGNIGYDENYSNGAKFYFRIPLNPQENIKNKIELVPSFDSYNSVSEGYPDFYLNVLIADDSNVNLEVLNEGLLRKNCVVTLAKNGSEAVDLYNRASYDLIILDIQMPMLDGIQAIKCIRDVEEKIEKHTPSLALSAFASIDEEKICLDAGFDGFISKPINWESLFNVIYQLCYDKIHSQSNMALFDIKVLESNLNGNRNLLYKLSSYLLESLPQNIDKLQNGFETNDASNVRALAHKMKSELGNFGALKLVSLLADIESCAKINNISLAKDSFATFVLLADSFLSDLSLAVEDYIPNKE